MAKSDKQQTEKTKTQTGNSGRKLGDELKHIRRTGRPKS